MDECLHDMIFNVLACDVYLKGNSAMISTSAAAVVMNHVLPCLKSVVDRRKLESCDEKKFAVPTCFVVIYEISS